jgi:hypothetical protein
MAEEENECIYVVEALRLFSEGSVRELKQLDK